MPSRATVCDCRAGKARWAAKWSWSRLSPGVTGAAQVGAIVDDNPSVPALLGEGSCPQPSSPGASPPLPAPAIPKPAHVLRTRAPRRATAHGARERSLRYPGTVFLFSHAGPPPRVPRNTKVGAAGPPSEPHATPVWSRRGAWKTQPSMPWMRGNGCAANRTYWPGLSQWLRRRALRIAQPGKTLCGRSPLGKVLGRSSAGADEKAALQLCTGEQYAHETLGLESWSVSRRNHGAPPGHYACSELAAELVGVGEVVAGEHDDEGGEILAGLRRRALELDIEPLPRRAAPRVNARHLGLASLEACREGGVRSWLHGNGGGRQ